MDAVTEELLTGFELHSIDRIQAVLDGGLDVVQRSMGRSPSTSCLRCI